VTIVFHSYHLDFYTLLGIETLLIIHVISLLIQRHAYTQDKYKIHFFNLTLYTILIVATSLVFDIMRVAICDLALALTLRGCELKHFKPYDQFHFYLQVTLYLDLKKIDTCDSSWLD
jgi:hypothetical protein